MMCVEIPELHTNPCGEDHLERLCKKQVDLSTHLHQAQQTHKAYMRIVISFHPVLTLEIGYGYYNDTSRLLTRPCDNLDYQRLGSFRIIEKLIMSLFILIFTSTTIITFGFS